MAKKQGYLTMIIWIKTPEKILLQRLKQADKKRMAIKQKGTWVDLYKKIQKKRFSKPKENEADILIIKN